MCLLLKLDDNKNINRESKELKNFLRLTRYGTVNVALKAVFKFSTYYNHLLKIFDKN